MRKKKFLLSKRFSWDISECIPHFYQVSLKCEAPSSNGCQVNDCPTTTITTIMACSLQQVCQQIRKKFKNAKIEKIIKFTKPALTRDSTSSQDPTCNTIVTPTPSNCQDCCDLIGGESSSFSSSSFDSSSSYSSHSAGILPKKPTKLIRSEGGDGPLSSPEAEYVHRPDMLKLTRTNNNFSYYGSGVITFSATSPLESTDGGELVQNITFSETATEKKISDFYSPTSALPLPEVIQTIKIPCCETPFTLTLELKHTLNKIKNFAAFLKTNNLTLPGVIRVGSKNNDFIKLNYSARDNQWRGTLHLTGQSPFGNGQISWNIGISFGCLQQFWQFAITLVNQQQNQRPTQSRLVAYYRKRDVCPKDDSFFGFTFMLNLTLLKSKPVTFQPIVLNDDAGFFRDLHLSFQILPQNKGSGSNQTLVDNTVPYDASFVTSGGN